jgi:hypothetical protein
VSLCPPQIPHDLTYARNQAAAVQSHRLTVWAMARLIVFILIAFLQIIIFLNNMSSFIFNHLRHTSSSHHFFDSGRFSYMCLASYTHHIRFREVIVNQWNKYENWNISNFQQSPDGKANLEIKILTFISRSIVYRQKSKVVPVIIELIKHHAMKTYGWVEVYIHPFWPQH